MARYLGDYTKDDTRTVYIYCLVDPRTSKIRYVGQTVNPKTRLSGHWAIACGSAIMRVWIRELKSINVKPMLVVLEETTGFYAFKMEHKWIEAFRNAGAPLLNQTYRKPDYRAITDERGY